MKVLVTGGTGFLGEPLIKRLTDEGHDVRVLSRNQGKLINLQQKYPIEIYSGDVCISADVYKAMEGVDGVYHLAASKHVGLAERLVSECVRSNLIGSINVLDASVWHVPEFVLGVSTDKAAQVAGVYGATKMLMERLFKEYDEDFGIMTKYRIVRYGNVLYSTGSVLCKWLELIQQEKEIIVTEPKATRFFWTVDQALDLIEDCLFDADGPEPYVPEMKAMSIENLLKALITKYLGVHNPYVKDGEFTSLVKIIGLQPGENLHEKILEQGPASNEVEQFTIPEIMELI